MKRNYLFWVSAVLLCFYSMTGVGSTEEIKGQKPMLVIDDTFRFVPDTWGEYTVRDKKKKQTYTMVMAMLEQQKCREGQCFWMEITIMAKDTPTVVTRFLTPQTPKGPGKPLSAIVQISGFDPFKVPAGFMKGEDAEVGQQQNYHLSEKIRKKTIKTKQGTSIEIWQVEAVNDKKERITAWVSEQLPPLGLYQVDTADTSMHIKTWGTGARSQITGKPMNFYLWLTKIVGKALVDGTDKKKK